MKGPAPPTPGQLRLGRTRLRQCRVGRHRDEGVECRIHALDPLEARFRELHRGELPGTNELSALANIELGQGRIHHRCHGLNLPHRRATDPTRLAGADAFRRNCWVQKPTLHL